MTASAVNGGVHMALSDRFSGLLLAQTINGSIRCDVPLSEIEVKTRTTLSGRIGEGRDTPINLQTANGAIPIRGR